MFQSFSARRKARKEKRVKKLTAIAEGSNPYNAQASHTTNAPARTLSPTNSNTMNRSHAALSLKNSTNSKSSQGTIRPVPTESLQIDTSDDDHQGQKADAALLLQPDRALSPFVNPLSSPPRILPIANGMVRTISAEFGPTRVYNNLPASDETNGSRSTSPGSSQWSSAVGHAGQGKSGRVIERLMSENDALRRDIKLERVNAETAREAKNVAEEKARDLAEQLEKSQHDTIVTKQLLKKQDRRVNELKAQIDGEKARTNAAVESERGWKLELDRTIAESKAMVEQTVADSNAKVEESKANGEERIMYAAMMEGRVKVMEDSWKKKDRELNKTVENLGREIKSLILERQADDQKIVILQRLCDQQTILLASLNKKNAELSAVHEAYKKEQENVLRTIKGNAVKSEETSSALLAESNRVLGELRWAIAVRENVRENVGENVENTQ